MAKSDQPKTMTMTEAARQQSIKPGTPEMETFLQAGYGMTIADAKLIVEEWTKDHKSWPLEEKRRAEAMLAAYTAVPRAIDTAPAWTRDELED